MSSKKSEKEVVCSFLNRSNYSRSNMIGEKHIWWCLAGPLTGVSGQDWRGGWYCASCQIRTWEYTTPYTLLTTHFTLRFTQYTLFTSHHTIYFTHLTLTAQFTPQFTHLTLFTLYTAPHITQNSPHTWHYALQIHTLYYTTSPHTTHFTPTALYTMHTIPAGISNVRN